MILYEINCGKKCEKCPDYNTEIEGCNLVEGLLQKGCIKESDCCKDDKCCSDGCCEK